MHVSQIVVVTKPYAEKRTYATCQKLLPNIISLHTSPQLSYEDYPEGEITKDLAINIMVGEIQRIKLYPEQGYTIAMPVSEEIEMALDYLLRAGYTHQPAKTR